MWNEATHKYTYYITWGPRAGRYSHNVKVLAYVERPHHMYVQFEDGRKEWVPTENLQKIFIYKGE